MTNVQLYLAVGIPTVLVLIGNNTRLARLEALVDGTNKRLDALVESIGTLRERVAIVEQHR